MNMQHLTHQVVKHTRCILAAEASAKPKHVITKIQTTLTIKFVILVQILPSGKIFIWYDFPKRQFSRFPTAVIKHVKNRAPRYPPNKLSKWEDTIKCLYICIPENMKIEVIVATINDVPLERAAKTKMLHRCNNNKKVLVYYPFYLVLP